MDEGATRLLYTGPYYKYMNLQHFERFCNMLNKGRLYGPTYDELNDPMEGKFDHGNLAEKYINRIYDKRRYTRLCSFSALAPIGDDRLAERFLMWSHYADGHKGVCVKFKIKYNKEWHVEEVHYSNTLYQPKGKNMKEDVQNIFLTKSDFWKMEEEYRAVKIYDPKKFYLLGPYLTIFIESIYIGRSVRADDIELYTSVIRSLNSKIDTYKVSEVSNGRGYPILMADKL